MEKLCFILFIFLSGLCFSQERDVIDKTFPESRMVNGQSVDLVPEGVLKFIISHRFGAVNEGIYNFFGLDDANMRIGFDYGINRWLAIGIGRSSLNREYDGYFKCKLIRQKNGQSSFPFTLTWYSDMAIQTIRDENPDIETDVVQRTTYAHQLLMARKFSPSFSLQIAPTLIYRNYVETSEESHEVYSIGIAPKLQLTKALSVNVEYYYVLEDQLKEEFENSLAIGFNFETKGHVFQLSMGNSRGLIEKAFITETTDKWEDGELHIGFHITRDFKIKGKQYTRSWN